MCDSEQYVTEIELIERKIKAKIPSDIGKLIRLEKVRSLLLHLKAQLKHHHEHYHS